MFGFLVQGLTDRILALLLAAILALLGLGCSVDIQGWRGSFGTTPLGSLVEVKVERITLSVESPAANELAGGPVLLFEFKHVGPS